MTATALGVGTEADIRDYFPLAAGQAKPTIAKLVADGELERVDVEGWSAPEAAPQDRVFSANTAISCGNCQAATYSCHISGPQRAKFA